MTQDVEHAIRLLKTTVAQSANKIVASNIALLAAGLKDMGSEENRRLIAYGQYETILKLIEEEEE